MIFIAGISIALLISALLLVKANKSLSDTFLFLWMILNAVNIAFFYLFYIDKANEYPALLGWHFPLPLLHGVMLYFYVASATKQLPKNKLILLAHLIPTLITIVYLIHFFILPAEQKIKIFENNGEEYLVFQQVVLYTVFLSGIIYVVWSTFLLSKHKKRIRNQFSNLESVNLNWLRFLTYGLGLVWGLVIFTQNDTLIFMGVSVFVILIGFFGLQQKSIFITQEVIPVKIDEGIIETKDREIKKETKAKYINSGLSTEKAAFYYEKLNRLINEDKFYTNPDLSLNELAGKLDIHPNYLSQIINNKENKSFYDYINTFRVNEFKNLIAIPANQQFTLMAIAYDCGFNSKSSFNRYFKKISGQTPSQYVKALKS